MESKNYHGIWVAKFEASSSNSYVTNGGGDNAFLYVNVKPNVHSWRQITVSNIFTVCQAMDKTSGALEGAKNVDSHMMKNVEWGAAVYLSRSKYGKNGQVWINPNSDYLTGQAGTSADASSTTSTNKYNTKNGQEASTTGNVYGIYDMSGCTNEFVATYVDNSNDTTSNEYNTNLLNADLKYKDVYSVANSDTQTNNYNVNKNKYGDAVYETSYKGENATSWENDHSSYLFSSSLVFARGGECNYGKIAGLFSFRNVSGNCGVDVSFRPVLAVR